MNTKQSLALISTSALAAGVAQGALVYSGPLNWQQPFTSTPDPRHGVDITGDGASDVIFGYETAAQKPYIDCRPGPVAGITQSGMANVLAKSNRGLPVTPAGTMIDATYAATYPASSDKRGYMFHDDNDSLAGDWSNTTVTDAYVGITLALPGGTSYGWLHLVDNPTTSPVNLTLVDWAYQTTPGVGVQTGVVPEPAAGALAGLGIAALLLRKRR